jgi:hypothetical protein
MRILQIIPDFSLGGIQKGGCVIAQGLHELGHECGVVGLGGGPRARDLTQAGVAALVADPRNLTSLVREWAPDIVHIHAAAFQSEVIRGLKSAAPRIVYTPVFGRPPDDNELLKEIRVCCVGQFTAWRLWRWLGSRERGIFSIPITPYKSPAGGQSALDDDRVAVARSTYGIPRGAFVAGRVARHDSLKWHPQTEVLVSTFLNSYSDAYWLSIGLPPDLGALRLKAKFGPRFINVCPIEDFERLSGFIQCLDLHVFASRYGECFSSSIAEGMGLAVPCVAICKPLGDCGEVEQIVPSVSGLIAANVGGLLECVRKLYFDRDGLRQMKEAAYREAQTEWDYRNCAERLQVAYQHWLEDDETPERNATKSHKIYEQVHFQRLQLAVGKGLTHQVSCAIAKRVYLNYTMFRLGRALRSVGRGL